MNLDNTMRVVKSYTFLSLSFYVQWWFYIHNLIIKDLLICYAKVSLSAIRKRNLHQSLYIERICKTDILKLMSHWLSYFFIAVFSSSILQHNRHWSFNHLYCCCHSYALFFSEFFSEMMFSLQLLLYIST